MKTDEPKVRVLSHQDFVKEFGVRRAIQTAAVGQPSRVVATEAWVVMDNPPPWFADHHVPFESLEAAYQERDRLVPSFSKLRTSRRNRRR